MFVWGHLKRYEYVCAFDKLILHNHVSTNMTGCSNYSDTYYLLSINKDIFILTGAVR